LLSLVPRSKKPILAFLSVVPVLGKRIGIRHGKFCIKHIHSIILGCSLQDAGFVLFGLAPKIRMLEFGIETAEEKSESI